MKKETTEQLNAEETAEIVVQPVRRYIGGIFRQKAVSSGRNYDAFEELSEEVGNRTEQLIRSFADSYEAQSKCSNIHLPEGKKQKKHFFLEIGKRLGGFETEPIPFFVGSCPDYSYDAQQKKYTHQSLGGDVPLLSQLHITAFHPMRDLLDKFQIPFTYKILLADVEALDEVFVEKFAAGNQEAFLQKCHGSVVETQRYMKKDFPLDPRFSASSFLEHFGAQQFMDMQDHFEQNLKERREKNYEFSAQVTRETALRNKLYASMYTDQFRTLRPDQLRVFLQERTIRTMAQYLSLGVLIRQVNGMVINHRTLNTGLYNTSSLLGIENPSPLPTLILNKDIY